MRLLLLTVAVIVGVVSAASAYPFKAQALFPAMNQHSMAARATGMSGKSFKERFRRFDAQQAQYLVPVSDAPICKGPDFVANLTKVYTLCAFVSVIPLSNSSVPPTSQGIRAAWEDFCSGVCMTTAKAVFDTYAVCLHPYLKLQGLSQTYMCENRDSSGDRCGVTASKFDAVRTCSRNNYQSTCSAASEFCSWTTISSGSGFTYSYCIPSFTQSLLSNLCSSCTMGLAKLNNQFPQYADSTIADGLNELCLQAPSGAYCLLSMTQFAQAGIRVDSLFDSQASLDSVCTNADLLYCVQASTGLDVASRVANARARFISCAKQYNNVTASVNAYCLPNYKSSLDGTRQSSGNSMSLMCLKNAAGKYCVPLIANFTSSSCFESTFGTGTCSSSCAPILSSFVSDLGCCVGTLQGFLTVPDIQSAPLSPEEFPYIPGYDGDTSTPAPTTPMAPAPGTNAPVVLGSGEELLPNPIDGGMYSFAGCGIDGLNQTLRKRCAVPTLVTVSGKLLIPMVFSEINSNPQRKMRVKGSLRIDVAGAARVPVSTIINDDIVESSSVKVTTTSAGRRQTTGATSANGCMYTYTIQATSSTDGNLAVANINNAAASGRLELTTTQATLSNECASTCAGSSGVSSIDQVQSGSTSGSIRVASTCIEVVAATFFLLLL
jgi:hypothetical protein